MSPTPIAFENAHAERLFSLTRFERGHGSHDKFRNSFPAIRASFDHLDGLAPDTEDEVALYGAEAGVVAFRRRDQNVYRSYAPRFAGWPTFLNVGFEKKAEISAEIAFAEFPGLKSKLVDLCNSVAQRQVRKEVKERHEPRAILRKALGIAAGEGLLSAQQEKIALEWLDSIRDPREEFWDE